MGLVIGIALLDSVICAFIYLFAQWPMDEKSNMKKKYFYRENRKIF